MPQLLGNDPAPYRYLTLLLMTANTADPDNPDIVQSPLLWNAPEESKAQH